MWRVRGCQKYDLSSGWIRLEQELDFVYVNIMTEGRNISMEDASLRTETPRDEGPGTTCEGSRRRTETPQD
jgi:hypothetical protein